MKNQALQDLTKNELIQLIELYSKNWLAMDGVWFQSIEEKYACKKRDTDPRHRPYFVPGRPFKIRWFVL